MDEVCRWVGVGESIEMTRMCMSNECIWCPPQQECGGEESLCPVQHCWWVVVIAVVEMVALRTYANSMACYALTTRYDDWYIGETGSFETYKPRQMDLDSLARDLGVSWQDYPLLSPWLFIIIITTTTTTIATSSSSSSFYLYFYFYLLLLLTTNHFVILSLRLSGWRVSKRNTTS